MKTREDLGSRTTAHSFSLPYQHRTFSTSGPTGEVYSRVHLASHNGPLGIFPLHTMFSMPAYS